MTLHRTSSEESETLTFTVTRGGSGLAREALPSPIQSCGKSHGYGLCPGSPNITKKRFFEPLKGDRGQDSPTKRFKEKGQSRERSFSFQGENSDLSTDTESSDLCCVEDDVFGRPTPSRGGSCFPLPEELGAEYCVQLLRPSSACSVSGPLDAGWDEQSDSLREIIGNMRVAEDELCEMAGYLIKHGPEQLHDSFIDESMRAVALSWMVEVACEFHLHQETLFLATSLVDRYLHASKAVERQFLQLIGVACLFIAAKHEEEICVPALEYTGIADHSFEHADLLQMESTVLSTLGFRVMTPTTFAFVSLMQEGLALNQKVCHLACYLLELSLLEYSLLEFKPSTLAAAAIVLADVIATWNDSFRDLPVALIASPERSNTSRENPKNVNRELVAGIQQMLGGAVGPLERAVSALAQIHESAFYTPDPVDMSSSQPCHVIKDKYRDVSFMAVSLDGPLEGSVIWPAAPATPFDASSDDVLLQGWVPRPV